MSRFEYLSVLVSIVIALGISEMTISWGRALQLRHRLSFSWLHLFWTLFIVFLMVQFWWGFWNFRHVEPWTLQALLSVLVEAVTLVLAALLLAPRAVESGPLNLNELFFANSRLFFLLGAALIFQLGAVDALVAGKPVASLENAFRVPGIGVALFAAGSTSTRLHYAVAVLALLLLAGFLGSEIQL
jgi:hypothetical protein